MSDLTPETFAELRRLLADGTPGPWSTVSGAGNVWHFRDEGAPVVVAGHQCAAPRVPDALLIAAAVTALPALLDAAEELDAVTAERDALAAAVERVRALHVEEHVYIGPSDPIGGFICRACGEPVESEPCPTIRVLDGEADHE